MTDYPIEIRGLSCFIENIKLKSHFECVEETWGPIFYGPRKGEFGLKKETFKLYKSLPRKGFWVGLGAISWLNKHNKSIKFPFSSIKPHRKPVDKILIPEKIENSPKFRINGRERFYFHEALEACRSHGFGSVKLPTGSGKTEIELTLANTHLNCLGTGLIVVPTLSIKEQFFERAEKYNIPLKEYGEESDELCIYCITPHKIVDHLSDNSEKAKSFLNSMSWVITDETHHASCKSWMEIILNCKNAQRIHGFSALPITETVHEAKSFNELSPNDAKVIGMVGPVIYEKSAEDLRDFLNLPHLINCLYQWEPDVVDKKLQYAKDWHKARQGIIENLNRTRYISEIFSYLVDHEYKVVTFVNQKEHAKHILSACGSNKVACWFGSGEAFTLTKNIEVEVLRTTFGKDITGLILTSHGIEGLDFSSPLNVLLLHEGKSIRQSIQKVGRIVRPDIKPSIVINIWDKGCNIHPKHSKQRSLDIAKEFDCNPIATKSVNELTEVINLIEEDHKEVYNK